MTNFKIKERQVTNVTVLDLSGKMRMEESGDLFCSTIHRLLEEGEREILLNLAGVTDIDSSGLGELIASSNTLRKNGGQVKLLHLTKRVRELMIISKLLTVFDVYDSETEALDSFKGSTEKLKRYVPPTGEEHPVISLALRQSFEAINRKTRPPIMRFIKAGMFLLLTFLLFPAVASGCLNN
jgi:anti-sigma B factor antagonist